MKHIKRSDHNEVIKGEREGSDGEIILPGVSDLSAKVISKSAEGPMITSHWEPDDDDRKLIAEGGVIELDVMAVAPPPVRCTVVPREPEAV